MRSGRSGITLVAGLVALALLAAACGGDDGTTPGGGAALSGELFISGSSTVEPITGLVAEKFSDENPGVAINVEGPGTSDGFELFCNGETDVQDASRAINEDEVAACQANGVEYVELNVAIDGLSVITSTQNTDVSCLAFSDLYALLGPESGGFQDWADANPLGQELSAPGVPYPSAPLVVTAPGEESGTYDSFVDLVLSDIAEERGQEVQTRPDYQSSGNDNVIVDNIAGTPTSLGWVGYAFWEQNQDVIRALDVDGGSGCVNPNPDTISSGEYPISRPLFIYVNKSKAAENAALSAFVDFYMTDVGMVESVAEVGYVNLASGEIESTRSTWETEKP
jgi:phosphate transport system substrate-binding protein